MFTILRIALGVGIGVGILYFSLGCVMYFKQDKMVYFPIKEFYQNPEDFNVTYEDVYLKTEDGVKIHGWFIPADSEYAAVFFHGNGGNISGRSDVITFYNKLKINLLIIDYHGYGKSEGKPGEQETYYDALASWQFLIEEKNFNPDAIMIHGRSLGGAIAAWLAVKKTPKVLILESAFTSVPAIASDLYPLFPVRWLVRYSYSTIDAIRKIQCPVLIIHSPDDDIIPFKHGEELFEAAPEPKRFLKIWGTHNSGYFEAKDFRESEIKKFLDEYYFQSSQ